VQTSSVFVKKHKIHPTSKLKPTGLSMLSSASGVLETRSYKSEKRTLASSCLSVCLSVCLPACISMAPTGQIFVKFYTGSFYENLPRNPTLGSKTDKKYRRSFTKT